MTTLKTKHPHHNSDYDLYADVEKIKAALTEATQDVKEKATEMLSDSVDTMKGKTTAVKDDVANYMVEKPFKSLGIALLIGFTIGYLLRK